LEILPGGSGISVQSKRMGPRYKEDIFNKAKIYKCELNPEKVQGS
jgi:hypothetical protein